MDTPLDFFQQQIGQPVKGSPSPFMHWLNPVIIAAEPGKLSFRYTVRKEMTNPMGTLHGGITAAIVDDAIGATIFSLNEEYFYTTLNNVIDYLATAREADQIIAETSLIKKGKQVINAQCEIWNADKTRLLAKGYSMLLKTSQKRIL